MAAPRGRAKTEQRDIKAGELRPTAQLDESRRSRPGDHRSRGEAQRERRGESDQRATDGCVHQEKLTAVVTTDLNDGLTQSPLLVPL